VSVRKVGLFSRALDGWFVPNATNKSCRSQRESMDGRPGESPRATTAARPSMIYIAQA